MFIFNYLEQKRKQASIPNKSVADDAEEDEEGVTKGGDVNDDEFEDYLDGFFGKKKNRKDEVDDEEIDFLKEFEGVLGTDSKEKKPKKKIASEDDDDVNDIDNDWGDDDDKEDFAASDMSEDEEASIDLNDEDDEGDEDDDDDASISLDEMDDNEDEDNSDSDSDIDDGEPKSKKSKKNSLPEIDERSFAKKLKQSDGKILLPFKLVF